MSGRMSQLAGSPRELMDSTSVTSSMPASPSHDVARRISLLQGRPDSPSARQVDVRPVAEKQAKVNSVLKKIKFFQDLDPNVQVKIPSIVGLMSLKAGNVLFTQGDPPGNCYVLLTGEVAVYVKPEYDEDAPGTPAAQKRKSILEMRRASMRAAAMQKPSDNGQEESRSNSKPPPATIEEQPDENSTENAATAALAAEEDSPASRRPASRQSQQSRQSEDSNESSGDEGLRPATALKQTVEGFSSFKSLSEFGPQVATLRDGTIFGELALINDMQRGATIGCQTDCELLVIRRSDFDGVLKAEMMRAGDEKLGFLAHHVPGMRDLEMPKFHTQGKTAPHPAYYLRRATYRKGHFLLTQGANAPDAIYVIFKGSLEIRHSGAGVTCAAVGNTPGQPGRLSRTTSARRQRGYTGKSDSGGSAGDRILGSLQPGAVFGALPMQAPEPYSVVVASASCEVFQAIGPDLSKLPRRLLEAIREYIASSTAWRLRAYVDHHFELPKAPKKAETSPVSGGRGVLLPANYRHDAG